MIKAEDVLDISIKNRDRLVEKKRKKLMKSIKKAAKKGLMDIKVNNSDLEEEILEELAAFGYEVITLVNDRYHYLIKWF